MGQGTFPSASVASRDFGSGGSIVALIFCCVLDVLCLYAAAATGSGALAAWFHVDILTWRGFLRISTAALWSIIAIIPFDSSFHAGVVEPPVAPTSPAFP